jgi:hypothetical protein
MRFKEVLWPLSIVLAFFAGTSMPPRTILRAQSAPATSPRYVQVDFMKALPGKEPEYVRLERDTWKPLHQARIRNGQLRSWAFFSVRFPSGADEKYDFVTINTYDRFGQIEEPLANFERLFASVHPNKSIGELSSATDAARRLIRSEMWQLVDETR